eukprot:7502099-Alexandrium_andersonii.AAC.1
MDGPARAPETQGLNTANREPAQIPDSGCAQCQGDIWHLGSPAFESGVVSDGRSRGPKSRTMVEVWNSPKNIEKLLGRDAVRDACLVIAGHLWAPKAGTR